MKKRIRILEKVKLLFCIFFCLFIEFSIIYDGIKSKEFFFIILLFLVIFLFVSACLFSIELNENEQLLIIHFALIKRKIFFSNIKAIGQFSRNKFILYCNDGKKFLIFDIKEKDIKEICCLINKYIEIETYFLH